MEASLNSLCSREGSMKSRRKKGGREEEHEKDEKKGRAGVLGEMASGHHRVQMVRQVLQDTTH